MSSPKLTAEESCQQVLKTIADACDQEALARAGGYVFRCVQEQTAYVRELERENKTLRASERELRRELAGATSLAEERLAHANQLQADLEAEFEGRQELRKRFGARDEETFSVFIERLAIMADAVPQEVHERGWQWRPTSPDTAFAPPFGTIRACRGCGCLVSGGPTACARCAKESP